jgi:molybdate/tungstate transport system substrate-binding protein
MMAHTSSRGARLGVLAAITCTGLLAAGCGSSSGSTSPSKSPTSSAKAAARTGTASVAYASSLEYLNEKVAGPEFQSVAGGFKYSGQGNSSGALESDIAAGEIHPNVFESVGADNITPLEPKFTKWYVQYAGTQIVVAYNPKSKYAPQLKAIADGKKPIKDLFTLMETPGFKLGRTDPNIDPQGRDFIYMLELAQKYYHLPADTVTKIIGSPIASPSSSQIYAESSLDSTLMSGQLDASSAFITQAVELHMPYIKLPVAINLSSFADAAQYAKATITISPPGGPKTLKTGSPQVIDITLIGKPTPAAIAFVAYTLSQPGLAQYKQGGFTLLKPTLTGPSSAVPSQISSELGG